jgi:hypothetical protein
MKSEEDSSLLGYLEDSPRHPQLHLITRAVATNRPRLRSSPSMVDYGFYKQTAPTALSVGDPLYFQPRSNDMFVVRSA